MGASVSLTGRADRGFTVVELVTVVLLLGILSITALGRFVRPSAFAPAVVTATVVSEVRYARQLAASRSDTQVYLELTAVDGDWRFSLTTDADGVVREQRVGMANTTLDVTSGAASASLGGGTGLRLEFLASGDLAAAEIGGLPGSVDLGIQLALGGDSARVICIYPSGYVTDSACL